MMSIRRRLMMMPHGIDTSPIIERYNAKLAGDIVAADGYCVTAKYYYQSSNTVQTIAYYFGEASLQCQVFRNNGETYMDYWVLQKRQSPRTCINAGSDAIWFTIEMNEINNCYAYIIETGQIFFAGKNTPYYGHRNISELN